MPEKIGTRIRVPAEWTRPCYDWSLAVGSAAARLDQDWILRETKCDPAIAEELAALLCAYGESV